MSFLADISNECQTLLLNAKKLCSSNIGEEELLQGAKQTAKATYQIVQVIQSLQLRSPNNGGIKQLLLDYSHQLRDVVVVFITNIRKLFTNPLDFLCQQVVANTRKEVVESVKRVLQAAKTLALNEGLPTEIKTEKSSKIGSENQQQTPGGKNSKNPTSSPSSLSSSPSSSLSQGVGVTSSDEEKEKDKFKLSQDQAFKINGSAGKVFDSLQEMEATIDAVEVSQFKEAAKCFLANFNDFHKMIEEYPQFQEQLNQLQEEALKSISVAGVAFQNKNKNSVYKEQFLARQEEFGNHLRLLLVAASAESKQNEQEPFTGSHEQDDKVTTADQQEEESKQRQEQEDRTPLVAVRRSTPNMTNTIKSISSVNSLPSLGDSKDSVKSSRTAGKESEAENSPQKEKRRSQEQGYSTTPPNRATSPSQSPQQSPGPLLKSKRGSAKHITRKFTKDKKSTDAAAIAAANAIVDAEREASIEEEKTAITSRLLKLIQQHFPSEWADKDDSQRTLIQKEILSELSNFEIFFTGSMYSNSTNTPPANTNPTNTAPPQGPRVKSGGAGVSLSQLFEKSPVANPGKLDLTKIKIKTTASSSTLESIPQNDRSMKELEKIMAISSPRDLNNLTIKVKRKPGSLGGKKKGDIKILNFSGEGSDARFRILKVSEICTGFVISVYAIMNYYDDLFHKNDLELIAMTPESTTLQDRDRDPLLLHFYQNVAKVFQVIQDTVDILNVSVTHDVAPPGSAVYKALVALNEVVETTPDRGEIIEVDRDILRVGRMSRYIKYNVLTTVNHKVMMFFFTVSQILTDMNDLQAITAESNPCLLHFISLMESLLRALSCIMNDVETLNFLEELESEPTARDGQLTARSGRQMRQVPTKEIWDLQVMKQAEQQIPPESGFYLPGDLNNLLVRLTPMSNQMVDATFNAAFLITVQRFATPESFIEGLLMRFRVPRVIKEQEKKQAIKLGVLTVLKRWIHLNYYLIDSSLYKTIKQFLDKLATKKKFDAIVAEIETDLKRTDHLLISQSFQRKPPSKIPAFGGQVSPFQSVLAFEEQIVAEQLTIIEFEIYSRIKPVELMGQVWNKSSRQVVARNVIELIQRSNSVSFWVASCILLQPRLRERAKAISNFITIAKHLRDLNNFNTLMGIIAGLSTSAVSRLRSSWAAVKGKIVETFESLQQVVNPSKAFQLLRGSILEAGNTALPYVGMYLTDLTFIEDGNPDMAANPNKISPDSINFHKHAMVYKAISELLQFQNSSEYGSKIGRKEPVFTFLFELPVLGEEELYKLSLEREPRD